MNEDIEDDYLDEEFCSYGAEIAKALSPCIKQFLTDYFGEKFYNLESHIYLDINKIIQEELELYGDNIPDILYRYRTITDADRWEEALNNFKRTDQPFPWPHKQQWYDKNYTVEDDDDFLDEIPESELTEEQKLAKQVVQEANSLINDHVEFSTFMKQGCRLFISKAQLFVEDNASFDLSILSAEGFESLQSELEMIAEFLFESLFGLLAEQES